MLENNPTHPTYSKEKKETVTHWEDVTEKMHC